MAFISADPRHLPPPFAKEHQETHEKFQFKMIEVADNIYGIAASSFQWRKLDNSHLATTLLRMTPTQDRYGHVKTGDFRKFVIVKHELGDQFDIEPFDNFEVIERIFHLINDQFISASVMGDKLVITIS